MSGTKVLANTNVIINHLAGNMQVEALLEGYTVYISSLTFSELLSSAALSTEEEEIVRQYLKQVYIIHTNDFICELAATLRRKVKIKLPDAIIAATGFFLDIPLITFDTDFEKIKDIRIIKLDL